MGERHARGRGTERPKGPEACGRGRAGGSRLRVILPHADRVRRARQIGEVRRTCCPPEDGEGGEKERDRRKASKDENPPFPTVPVRGRGNGGRSVAVHSNPPRLSFRLPAWPWCFHRKEFSSGPAAVGPDCRR